MKTKLLLRVVGFGTLGAGACGGDISSPPPAADPTVVDAGSDASDSGRDVAVASDASAKDASTEPSCDGAAVLQPGECVCGACGTPNIGQIVSGAGPLPHIGD